MRCPYCGHESLITTETRLQEGGEWRVKRERYCKSCKVEFSTFELPSDAYDPLRKAFAAVSGIAEMIAAFQDHTKRKPQH